jgi:hypothetical protein
MSSLRKRGSDSASVAVGVGAELLKLVREMLVIPAQIWLTIAEVTGAVVLLAWRRIVLPALGAVVALLIAGGLLLPRYLRPAPAASRAETTANRGLGRARRLLTRGGDKLERGRTGARGERPVEGEGSVSGAST